MGVLVPLLTLVLGVILGGLSQAVLERYSAFRESQAVAAALRAEIQVVLGLIERRQHLQNLGHTISYLQTLTSPPGPADLYRGVTGTQETYSVFHSLCGKLGLLGNAAEPVVTTYTIFKALDDDISGLVEQHRTHPLTLPQLIRIHTDMLDLLRDAVAQGQIAIANLRMYERRRFRLLGEPK